MDEPKKARGRRSAPQVLAQRVGDLSVDQLSTFAATLLKERPRASKALQAILEEANPPIPRFMNLPLGYPIPTEASGSTEYNRYLILPQGAPEGNGAGMPTNG